MKAIDEAKVKEIVRELKGKSRLLLKLLVSAKSDDVREALVEDMVDIERIVLCLSQLENIPDDSWTLGIGRD